jgi:hypothetical protein
MKGFSSREEGDNYGVDYEGWEEVPGRASNGKRGDDDLVEPLEALSI